MNPLVILLQAASQIAIAHLNNSDDSEALNQATRLYQAAANVGGHLDDLSSSARRQYMDILEKLLRVIHDRMNADLKRMQEQPRREKAPSPESP